MYKHFIHNIYNIYISCTLSFNPSARIGFQAIVRNIYTFLYKSNTIHWLNIQHKQVFMNNNKKTTSRTKHDLILRLQKGCYVTYRKKNISCFYNAGG